MKKLLIGASALGLLGVAAPASAQYYPQTGQYSQSTYGRADVGTRIQQLELRLQEGQRNGSITRSEAAPIRQQIRQLRRAYAQYAVNGISGQENAMLQQSVRNIRQQLRVADNGAQGRYNAWDREDGYGYQQGYQQGYNQPYQQGYNQPYQQGYALPQTGVAGVIGRLLGTGGLQVGQRVTSNLGAVPYQYQGQYRDGNGVYYRSDGRQIYQVDARSQTVIRIFPM